MADTTPVETAAVAPSNEPNTPAPVVGIVDVEAAKREAAQAQIRANQLQNELDRIKAEQATAQQKQLEEKEEFKTLYEQTQTRLKEIEDASVAKERTQQLTSDTNAILSEYSDSVVELAKTVGLSLTDDSDAAKASLKEKLDAFKAKVGVAATVTSNNPSNPVQASDAADSVKRTNPFEGSPMALASAKGDLKPQLEYIRGLKGIQRMKEIAQNGN